MIISLVSAQIYFPENFGVDVTNRTVNAIPDNDAAVAASYSKETIYSITSSPTTYNFTTHSYDTLPSNGVRFSFTAPQAGNYSIVVSNNGSVDKFLYYYGTSNFSKVDDVIRGTGTINHNFNATATGEVHYFAVIPFSSSNHASDFTINYTNAFVLTVTSDGNGSINPSSVILNAAKSQPIIATPYGGYRFDNWTVLSGEATISSLTSQSTFVTISSDATVQANFSKGTVYPITSSPSTYNFTTHHYEIQPSNGVRFSFIAPQAGNYSIVVSSPVTVGKNIYYYGTSGFAYYEGPVSGTSTVNYNFNATAADEVHYFKVAPSSNIYTMSSFFINYTNAYGLTLTSDSRNCLSR